MMTELKFPLPWFNYFYSGLGFNQSLIDSSQVVDLIAPILLYYLSPLKILPLSLITIFDRETFYVKMSRPSVF